MKPSTRSFVAVLISGLIVWLILSASLFFKMQWWGFLFMLGATYLVVDASLQALLERRSMA